MDINNKGFTLVELIATVAVISVIFLIAFTSVNNAINNSDKTLDKATKNMILEAAKDYAIEFRGTDNWREQVSDNGDISFCISLDSLINYGYFKNNQEKISEYKEEYLVKVIIENGVYDYNYVKISDLSEDDLCRYYDKSSEVNGNTDSSVDIKDSQTEKSIGAFGYKINKVGETKYSIDFKLDINLYDKFNKAETPTYVTLLVDYSSSMYSGDKLKNAISDSITFSENLVNQITHVNIALINYGTKTYLQRNFSNTSLTTADFLEKFDAESALVATNTPGAIDLATSLIYNSGIYNDTTNNIYTILLYDGAPNYFSSMQYDGAYHEPSSLYEEIGTYTITGNATTYFTNFLKIASQEAYTSAANNAVFEYNSMNLAQISTGTVIPEKYEAAMPHLSASSNYLMALGSKLIVIGYEFNFNNSPVEMKSYSSEDDKLCDDSNYSSDGKNYCYYDSTTNNLSDLFENILEKVVISNTNAIGAKLVFESEMVNGNSFITILKNGEAVENNLVKIDLNVSDIDEAGNLVLEDDYYIQLNDELYEFTDESCSDELCEVSAKNLFNIYVELIYSSDIVERVEIEEPEFSIVLSKMDTIN